MIDESLPTLEVDTQDDGEFEVMPPQYQMVLEQQYFSLVQIRQINDHLDNKAMTLLQAAGLILALIGVLKIPGFITAPGSNLWALAGIITGFTAFALMILLVLLITRPTEGGLPGTQDWNRVYDLYVTVDLAESFDKILVDILNAYEIALRTNDAKANRLSVAFVLFAVQIIGLLVLALAA